MNSKVLKVSSVLTALIVICLLTAWTRKTNMSGQSGPSFQFYLPGRIDFYHNILADRAAKAEPSWVTPRYELEMDKRSDAQKLASMIRLGADLKRLWRSRDLSNKAIMKKYRDDVILIAYDENNRFYGLKVDPTLESLGANCIYWLSQDRNHLSDEGSFIYCNYLALSKLLQARKMAKSLVDKHPKSWVFRMVLADVYLLGMGPVYRTNTSGGSTVVQAEIPSMNREEIEQLRVAEKLDPTNPLIHYDLLRDDSWEMRPDARSIELRLFRRYATPKERFEREYRYLPKN